MLHLKLANESHYSVRKRYLANNAKSWKKKIFSLFLSLSLSLWTFFSLAIGIYICSYRLTTLKDVTTKLICLIFYTLLSDLSPHLLYNRHSTFSTQRSKCPNDESLTFVLVVNKNLLGFFSPALHVECNK